MVNSPVTETIGVGELVARFLERVGPNTLFGVISIHNMPILDAVSRRNRLRFVPCRGEAGAASMADAFARVSGGLGGLITSTGPGCANAAGGLLEARIAGSPVLHLTGQTARHDGDRGRGAVHDVPDQPGLLRSVSKAVYRARSPATVLGTIVRAAAEALTPPMGPVSVELPIDVQRGRVPVPAGLESLTLPLPTPLPPDPAALDGFVERIAMARRPLLWLGNGARHAGGAAARLAAMGFGIVTSMAGRGVVPEDHPMSLGAFTGTPEVLAFYRTVDLMVIAGSRLRGHETLDETLPLPEPRLQIDVDPAADNRTYGNAQFLCADSALALSGIADGLEGRFLPDPDFAGDLARVGLETRNNYRDLLGPYGVLCDALRAAMPRDAVWARDITLCNSSWGNRLLSVYGPRDSVYSIDAGVGMGLAFGIGANLAATGRKVVTLCGDGGFIMNLGELWTAAQERVDNVFLVMNDGGYGVMRNIADAHYGGHRFYDRLDMPGYEALARSADMPYWRLESAEDTAAVMGAALAVDGPALVEADMAAIGPFPASFSGPPPPKTDDSL